MIFLPIRTEKETRKYPNLTIGLIVMNVAIWIATNGIMQQEFDYLDALHERMLEIEHQYLYADSFDDPSILKEGNLLDIRQAIFDQRLIPSTASEYQEWLALFAEFKEKANHLFYHRWGFVPGQFNLLKIITSMFIHGSFLHVFGNMLFLWIVGCNMEDDWGWKKYLGFYLLGGVAAAITHFAADPSSFVPCIGASGAVAAVMGVFMVQHFKIKIRFFYFFLLLFRPMIGTIKLAAGLVLPFWFLIEWISAQSGVQTGTAHWAHVGGFVLGGVIGLLVKTFKDADASPEARKPLPSREVLQAVYQHLTPVDSERLIDPAYIRELHEIVRSEPYHYIAMVALGRFQMKNMRQEDARINFNKAFDVVQELRDEAGMLRIYQWMKKMSAISCLAPHALYKIGEILEKKRYYRDAVDVYAVIVKMHPQSAVRPRCMHKAAGLLMSQLNNPELAGKVSRMLKKEYPDFAL